MLKNSKKRYILLAACILLCAGVPVSCFAVTGSVKAAAVAAAPALAAAACAVMIFFIGKKSTEDLLGELSDMISAIGNPEIGEVYPVIEDSLLSKLQNQVTRLSEMLVNRNRMIEGEKNEIKTLISDISHQLKTPVATLKMYGDLMLDTTAQDEERAEYKAAFEAALDKLLFLTQSMIKMSRLESGIIVLGARRAALRDTLLEAVMQAFEKARRKNVEIVFDSDACNITPVHDPKWTAEAIFNILDNAVKYTESGGMVKIETVKYDVFARIDITDNGSGIPEAELPKIFGRFYRGQGSSVEEGVGIGLYLSRKIITDQGGYIKAKSCSEGSVFSVFLPLG